MLLKSMGETNKDVSRDASLLMTVGIEFRYKVGSDAAFN